MFRVLMGVMFVMIIGVYSFSVMALDAVGINKIKPQPLKRGDTIGIVAPGYLVDRTLLDKGSKYLESQGYKVLLGEHIFDKSGFLAGKDDLRAKDINEMFANPDVKAIICARGGYGSIRLVEKLDFEVIKKNPKIFIGYSDITTLLTAIYQNTGLVTFHGPMVASDMSKDKFDLYNGLYLLKAVSSNNPVGQVINPIDYQETFFIKNGVGQGELIGGNLTVILSSLGTPFEIDTKNRLLFVEEVGESTYRIDRMLQQLKLAGKFDEITGFIFGESIACGPENENDPTTLEIVQEFVKDFDVPVMYGLTIGHGIYKATLPIGVEAVLDSKTGLRIIESGVKPEDRPKSWEIEKVNL